TGAVNSGPWVALRLRGGRSVRFVQLRMHKACRSGAFSALARSAARPPPPRPGEPRRRRSQIMEGAGGVSVGAPAERGRMRGAGQATFGIHQTGAGDTQPAPVRLITSSAFCGPHMKQTLTHPSKEEVVGCYFNPDVGASGLRLTLFPDGQARLEKWLDLGATWILLRTGEFVLVGSVILTTFRDFDWCGTSFAQDGELHIRRLRLRQVVNDFELAWCFVLASSDSVEALDQAVQEDQPHLDRLRE